MRSALLLLALCPLAACTPDDGAGDSGPTSDGGSADGGADSGDAGAPSQTDLLVGDWVSEGDDVSSLLAYYGYTRVDARFEEGGAYTVDATGGTGAVDSYAGTWTGEGGTDPAAITLDQSSPSAIIAMGIFSVADDVLTYEVVQTSPDIGCTPPTVQSGFATTDCAGQTGDYNVQVFRRP
jgi:hypothetical protein